jgi:hypothetical protein
MMKVTIHKLFDYLLETTASDPPECFIGFSLARSPRLRDFLPDLDPELSLGLERGQLSWPARPAAAGAGSGGADAAAGQLC